MRKYLPMLISDGEVPFGEDWTYQIKWDGVRCIAYIGSDGVRLLSREGFDLATSFPDVVEKLKVSASETGFEGVLDGELIVMTPGEVAGYVVSFDMCLVRAQAAAPIKVRLLQKDYPGFFLPFDVLEVHNRDLTSLPLKERLALMPEGFENIKGVPYDVVVETVQKFGHEGFVARNLNAPYIEGERPTTNIRWKNINTLDAVIYGYEKGDGVRYKDFGAFHCKVLDDVGGEAHVSSGFSDSILKELIDSLEVENETDEFVTVKKDIIIEVNYLDIGSDNRVRNPSFSRIRADKVYK